MDLKLDVYMLNGHLIYHTIYLVNVLLTATFMSFLKNFF